MDVPKKEAANADGKEQPVIDGGKIAEQWTHSELMKMKCPEAACKHISGHFISVFCR